MNQAQLALLNVGENIDQLMNLDPRGYGVCRILYGAARNLANEPLSVHAARDMRAHIHEGGIVFIITGFVLRPYNKAETDGPIGAAALARALIKAFGAKPVFICPEEACAALEKISAVMGFHLYKILDETLEKNFDEVKKQPLSAGLVVFSKDRATAPQQAASLLAAANPEYCIAIEAPGANDAGMYHNAIGLDVSALEAKSDVLFAGAQAKGIPTLAIGDLGNECGMGAIREQLLRYIPYAARGRCACPCGGGIAAATAADTLVTATVSNWGAYGIIAALAYLCRNPDILHTAQLEERALTAGAEAGLIDMYGWQIPAVDGMNLEKITAIITLMGECVISALQLEETCKTWFEKTIELGFFDGAISKEMTP